MQRPFFLFSLVAFIFALLLMGIGIGRLTTQKSPASAISSPSPVISLTSPTGMVAGQQEERIVVKKVVDGDTIELSDSRRVRYIGIDTPETVDPRRSVGCFGREASDKNKELVLGKEIELEKDISETDRYGRLLRYVYVAIDGKREMVNEYLVRQGYANSSSYPPDIKYQEQFREAEQEAREGQRGLWNLCMSSPSSQVGAAVESEALGITEESTDAKPQSLSGCTIKGNITTDKIYHLPGCGSYDKTAIDESMGEKWFCSEAEAESAGWRKAKNC